MYNDKLTILPTSPLFAGMSPEDIQHITICFQPRVVQFSKHTYLAIENQPFTGLGILLTGEASVVKETMSGARIILTMLQAGNLFGEMIAFSAKPCWPASVVAQTDCSALFIPPQKIVGECAHACPGHQQLIRNLLGILSEKAILLNRKVEYLSLKSLRSKIATYLLEQQKRSGKTIFLLPLKRNDLADFLNVSRTALSREMGRMRDEGLIEFYRSSIKLLQPEKLKKNLF